MDQIVSGASPIVKRSIKIAHHQTSVSLEREFYEQLQIIARRSGKTIGDLVSAIDGTRTTPNLSSALRVFILQDALSRVAALELATTSS
jgi:predicted DNA-binding ribbon-helix-helix protein